jgi:F-type H+-transporting ATPase subunit b
MINFDKYDYILVFINLIILYFVMRKLLFKPITKFMEDRTNSIKTSIENAEKAQTEAYELKDKYSLQISTAKEDASKILDDTRARANKEYEQILKTAKEDAQRLLAQAKEEIEIERTKMVNGIKNQVSYLALAAASKVIESNMNTEQNKVLVDKFIKEVGV